MKLTGTPQQIYMEIQSVYPQVDEAMKRARIAVPYGKKEVYPHQAACLYALAQEYDQEGAIILEIGTYYGYTAAVMAEAAPKACILTLNVLPWEYEAARHNLKGYFNLRPLCVASWDYLDAFAGKLDMVFIDGDHAHIKRDLPWWNRLRQGGLMLFHDYSPAGSKRECPPVYEAICEFASWLGREPDVSIVDDGGAGMAGFVKMENDPQWKDEL